MNRNPLYICIAILAVITSVVIVVGKKIPKEELNLLFTKGVLPATIIHGKPATPRAARSNSDAAVEDAAKAAPVEHTDEEMQKWLAALPVLRDIPWESFEIAAMFSNRSARPCQLLPPDSSIEPLVTNVEQLDGKLVTQRTSAFLVGLMMDSKARGSLPSLSKATIENYLAQHLLAIQPEICRNRNGEFMMTGNVNAAFFAKAMPSITGSPEPMIGDAVKSFRVLGVLPPVAQNPGEAPLPRTLVMAFSYMRDKTLPSNLSLGPQPEYELLFIHLLPQLEPTAVPQLAVFTTTEGRTVFQELELSGQSSRRNEAAVMATIRFEDFKLMGLYPANPIVTGLANKIRGSLSIEDLRSRIQTREGASAAVLETILDELHNGPEFTKVSTIEAVSPSR